MNYINLFIYINFVAYIYLIYSFIKNIKKQSIIAPIQGNKIPISVIIAIKNGKNSLPNLINCLQNQTYQGDVEYILVDDQSTDDTKLIIKKIETEDKRFKFETSKNGNEILSFKKKALDAGINIAKYEWLLFTDVDCKPPVTWIEEMAAFFTDEVDYVIGMSSVIPDGSLVSNFQSIDFQMLMAASYAQANKGSPWACTGQNQAYRKSLFNKVDGFKHLANLLQGDDSVFMQICRYSGARIIPAITKNPMVARTEKDLISLLKQRMRWAGDSKYMIKLCPTFFIASVITYITNIGLLFFLYEYRYIFIFNILNNCSLFILYKLGIEYSLYHTFIKTSKLKNINIIYWLQWFCFQVPYIIIVGSMSFSAHKLFGWKNNKA